MSAALNIIQQAYEAFGRRDIPALLNLVGDQVDWAFVGPASLAYAGTRQNKNEVASFFSELEKADDTLAFEPREFIEAGDNVTVLGWIKGIARDTKIPFETEWAHVFTVRDGKVVRWRGFANTAARYGH
jgi:ketosteroid isomerase-like protein